MQIAGVNDARGRSALHTPRHAIYRHFLMLQSEIPQNWQTSPLRIMNVKCPLTTGDVTLSHGGTRFKYGTRPRESALRQNVFYHMSVNVRKTPGNAVVIVRQPFVINSQQMQDRGMKIVDRDRVFGRLVAHII